MKYKVGDRVKVREDLEVGKHYGGYYFTKGMEKYKGKISVITRVGGHSCKSAQAIAKNLRVRWIQNYTDELFEKRNKGDI